MAFKGGLARTTGDAALILDASGKDTTIIETVGVGRGEVTADVSVVVLVPTSGDAIILATRTSATRGSLVATCFRWRR